MSWRHASQRMALWSVCLLPAGFAWAQTPPVFSAEEQRWIAQHPVVRYVADTRLAPLEYTEDGLYKGLIAEYLEAVARKSGLRFERVPTQNWEDAQQAFLEGKADLFPNVNAQRTHGDVSAQLRLTDPYFLAPTIIVTRTDAPIILNMKDLDGKVAAIRGAAPMRRYSARVIPRFARWRSTSRATASMRWSMARPTPPSAPTPCSCR